jgi:ferrous iron transport protein B
MMSKVENEHILSYVDRQRADFILQQKEAPEKVIALKHYQAADAIAERVVTREKEIYRTLTDKIDSVVCNRFSGPVILLGVIYLFYELSIVQGYKITAYTWPILAAFRNFTASILPSPGFVFDPLLRTVPLGVIDGIVAVLNYVPIFAILFALIAIMEDSGYMARVAFILDRVFRYFGLHGQSALPMILSGVFVGGCAIPGVMACRAIKDEKAKLATILICPLMNCLAKIPLYILLVGMFFAAYKGITMFFISTITIIIALSVAKILSLTVLRGVETAPFVLEMPPYHVPTVGGVLRSCVERLWLFVKKIITIVIIVALIIYLLMTVPGLGKDRKSYYQNQADQQIETFFDKTGQDNPYAKLLEGSKLTGFAIYWDNYKKAKMGAGGRDAKKAVDEKFRERDSEFFKIVKRGKYIVDGKKVKDKYAMKVNKAYKKLNSKRNKIKRDIKEETIIGSVMGRIGVWLEPVTKYAGFNWRINIGLISAFAAKENSVATLGSIYQNPPGEKEKALGVRMKEKEKGCTPLHALAIILFMTMYPPCIPTLLMVKLESNSTKWMLFATFYPIVLGSVIAVLVFTGGNLLGLSGMQAMVAFYIFALGVTIAMGFIKEKDESKYA